MTEGPLWNSIYPRVFPPACLLALGTPAGMGLGNPSLPPAG